MDVYHQSCVWFQKGNVFAVSLMHYLKTRDVACLYMIGQTSLPGRVGRRLEGLGVPSSPVPASTTVTSGNILLKQF